MASQNNPSSQLALSDYRNPALSSISKSLCLTPGTLGLENAVAGSNARGDGWSISPWINMAPTPSAGMASDVKQTSSPSYADSQRLKTGMAFDNKKSLASRRGFSGSLQLETRVT
ncbi:hypothetical protein EX895_005452 [Sporisorium graminicola]|uniref:Uncharacterized protein n=1 Tax=Sporisorium graminicola TaxID=280036 RepID=A0A4U7KNJ1_9BASI|nr:hypothetical protein EX895_005452 [Sporisorium graminicola]TKY85911.1 hypothetical protein EX895_005452 [Sporisorium graminicola]